MRPALLSCRLAPATIFPFGCPLGIWVRCLYCRPSAELPSALVPTNRGVGFAAGPSQLPAGAGGDFPFWMPVGHPGSLFSLAAFGRIDRKSAILGARWFET